MSDTPSAELDWQEIFVRASQLDQKYQITVLAERASADRTRYRAFLADTENYRKTVEANPQIVGIREHLSVLRTSVRIAPVRRRGHRTATLLQERLGHIVATEPFGNEIVSVLRNRLRLANMMSSIVAPAAR